MSGSSSVSPKLYVIPATPKEKQLKPDSDGAIQTMGKKEACSPHDFPTSHVLRTRSGVKHRKTKPLPKEPFSRQMKGARSIPRAQAGIH